MGRMAKEEAYEVLGLKGDEEKTEEDVRRAYKKMALATHPDKNTVSRGGRLICCSVGVGFVYFV